MAEEYVLFKFLIIEYTVIICNTKFPLLNFDIRNEFVTNGKIVINL